MKPRKDLTGQTFGRLKVIKFDEEKSVKRSYWICECSCPNHTIKSILGQNLLNGSTKSCGCWNKERDRTYSRPNNQKDMVGKQINNLTVLHKDPTLHKNKAIYWVCHCNCCNRNDYIVDGRVLRLGKIFSCGCVKSKGELKISQILTDAKVLFKSQYIFDKLPNRKFDFAIFDKNNSIQFLIEYDGEQHFDKNSRYYSKEQINRDGEKDDFCLKNNIKLYRIPYYDYDIINNIDDILKLQYQVI